MTPLSTRTRWDAQLFIERFGFRSVLKRGLGDGSPPLLKGCAIRDQHGPLEVVAEIRDNQTKFEYRERRKC
jgi:hypothetical protein